MRYECIVYAGNQEFRSRTIGTRREMRGRLQRARLRALSIAHCAIYCTSCATRDIWLHYIFKAVLHSEVTITDAPQTPFNIVDSMFLHFVEAIK